MANRSSKVVGFLEARLSPQGYFGLYLTLGVLFLILATWLFGHIAEDVWNSEHLTIIDVHLSSWLHAHSIRWLTVLMIVITDANSQLPIGIVSALLAFFLFRKRDYYWLVTLITTVFGGMLLNVVLKQIFQRSRPEFTDPILTLHTYAFPSGHTMTSTCFYGVLIAFAFSRITNWPGRLLALLLGGFMILVVGFSRLYLGAHYLSDVLGAMAEGLAWLAFCLTAVEALRRGRARRRDLRSREMVVPEVD